MANGILQPAVGVAPKHGVEAEGQHTGFGQHAICTLQRQVASPARLVELEETLLLARRDAVDAELAPRQLAPPIILPGKEVGPGEQALEGAEKPRDVIGLDPAQA